MKRPALGCVHNLKRVSALKGGGAAVLVFVCLQLCPSVALSFFVSVFCLFLCVVASVSVSLLLSFSLLLSQLSKGPFAWEQCIHSILEHLKHTFSKGYWTVEPILWKQQPFSQIRATIIPGTWIVGANWRWNGFALATVAGAISFTNLWYIIDSMAELTNISNVKLLTSPNCFKLYTRNARPHFHHPPPARILSVGGSVQQVCYLYKGVTAKH